jgi:rSAM/selenodomain-associated transferase 2
MKISVIIPTLNEGTLLRGTLSRLRKSMDLEVIVVDGGSHDNTVEIAKEFTKKVLTAPRGRAKQMNEGARHAVGEILLFLHADSRISPGGIGKIVSALTAQQKSGGAFHLAFESRHPIMKMIAWLTNVRTRMTQIPYGDQGIFITRALFQKLGGYPDIPIMEDVVLSTQIKKEGGFVFLNEKMTVSARRWEKEGIFYTTFRNRLLMIGYQLGISPDRLAKWV